MKIKSSHWLLGVVFAVIVYLIILLFSDFPTLVQNFKTIKMEYVYLAILVVYVSLIVTGIRWYLMIRDLGIVVNFKSSMLVYLCGNAFALSPGRLGEVLRSFYLKRLCNVPVSKTAPTIIVERFFDVFAILVIALSANLILGVNHEIIIFGYIVLGGFLILIYQKKYLKKILEQTKKIRFCGKISTMFLESLDIIYILLKPKIFVKIFFLSIVSWIIESLVVYFALKAFSIDLSIIKSIFIQVISTLVGSATFLPGGIGVTEGGLIGLFLLEGIPYNDAIGPVLLVRLIVLWSITIVGIIINFVAEATVLKNK